MWGMKEQSPPEAVAVVVGMSAIMATPEAERSSLRGRQDLLCTCIRGIASAFIFAPICDPSHVSGAVLDQDDLLKTPSVTSSLEI